MYEKIVKIFTCLMLISFSRMLDAQPITGDGVVPGQAFSAPVAAYIYERINGSLFVATKKASEKTSPVAHYSVSISDGTVNQFSPLVPNLPTTVNGKDVQENPLLGAGIEHFGLLVYNPLHFHLLAITQAEPHTVYLLSKNQQKDLQKLALLSTGTLYDAHKQQTPRIAAIATNYSQVREQNPESLPSGLLPGMAVFAAVTGKSGVFGQEGSGIATAVIQKKSETELAFDVRDAVPFDKSSESIAIGSPVTTLHDHIVMKNSINLAVEPFLVKEVSTLRLFSLSHIYVGLHVQGGAAQEDGVHGLLCFRGYQQAITPPVKPQDAPIITTTVALPQLQQLAPAQAITQDSIIAAKGPLATVCIHKIDTMTTTSRLRYLIVVGGVVPYGNARTVFALPLVTETGLLAQAHAQPKDWFNGSLFSMRTLPPAVTAGDLYTSQDIPAQVGAGALPGDITHLAVVGDAVFASLAESETGNPGIFHSQALFDAAGKIKGWTSWKRVANKFSPVHGFALDEHSGNMWSFRTTETGTTVERTSWKQPEQGYAHQIHQIFSRTVGGVQGLFEFPQHALTIATGDKRVVLIQYQSPHETNLFTITDCSHAVLDDIGAIVAATVVSDGASHWIVVGGAHGVAVVACPDRSRSLDLTADMQWTLLGNYHGVRKLIANENGLYVLTHTTLERIDISPTQIQQGKHCEGTVLAQGGISPEGHLYFSDALISKKFGLLATSAGLVQVGNGTDLRTATKAEELRWQPVALHYGVGPVTRLFAITQTGNEQDIVQEDPLISGNVYALNACVGYNQARVYRFALHYTGEIDDTTLQPINDVQIAGPPSYFMTFGKYRNHIATDGALFAVSRSKFIKKPAYLELLAPTWSASASANLIGAKKVITEEHVPHIGQMIRSYVTGSWLVPGGFGLFVNE